MLNKFHQWLWPHYCVFCRELAEHQQMICTACKDTLPWQEQACMQCGSALSTKQTTALRCGSCLKNPPYFDEASCLFHYAAPIDRCITQLKFHQQLNYAKLMSELFADKLQRHYQQQPLPDCIIPVPLHRKRLRQRGYNQALELGKLISQRLDVTLDIHHVQRVKNTAAQSTLPGESRKKNLRNAFAVHRKMTDQHIAIIDDVMTTGTTVNELSHALKDAGANKVTLWIYARALLSPN